MAARPPQLSGQAIAQALARHSREPFIDLMAQLLAGAPDGAAIKEWAARHPSEYAQALLSIGQLAGYRT